MKHIAFTLLWLTAITANAATLTTNGSAADVQAKINSAVTGDTVVIPAGTFLWNTTVTIPATKGITLQGATTSTVPRGAGTTGTTIQRNSVVPNFDSLQVTIGATNPGTRITGLRFDDIGPGGWPQGDNTFIQVAGGPVGTTLLRIDNCYFKNLVGGPMRPMCIFSETPLLIDHCTFEVSSSNKEIIQNNGRLPKGATQVLSPGWDDDVIQSRQVFIEDCKFINNFPIASGGANSSIQQYAGARVTVRHNDFQDVCIDVHGTEGNAGGRWWEIYENNFIHPAGQSFDRWVQIRAGSGVIFNNVRTPLGTSSYNGGFILWEEDGVCWGETYPFPYMVGHGKNMVLDPAYIWNNTSVGGGAWGPSVQGPDVSGPPPHPACASEPSQIVLNREYFLSPKPGYTPYTYPHPLQGAVVVTAPSLSTMSPTSAIAGSGAFTLTVNGLRFVSGAIVKWNGQNRTTSFGSATQLTAAILATDIASVGTATITVLNPNGETSNALTFTISTPTPLGTLYVDKDGGGIDNASQPGTQALPFASIPYAVSRMVAGDEILVKQSATPYTAPSGIFLTISGTNGNPCAIRAFPGHTPRLVGTPPASVIVMTGVNWWEIEGMDISNGDFIIWIRNNSNNITLRNNVLHDSTAQIVYVSNVCSNLLFEANNLEGGGSIGTQNGEGFYIGSAAAGDTTNNVIIRDNAITNMKHEAIEFKPNTNNCIAEGNVITDVVHNFDFGIWAISAHPGTTGTNPNHIIRNNIISGVGDAGITTQPGAAFLAGTGVQIYNNVVYNADSDGDGIYTRAVQFEGTGDIGFTRYFWHNTYTGPSASAIYVKSGTNNSIGNNIGPPTTQATNNLPYNPAYFVNPVGNDFHLVAGSAPIDAGTTPPFPITTDFDGNPRVAPPDIGAFESTVAIPVVNTPTFSVPAGPYFNAQSVAINCSTTGATIRYTTDGTDPTASSPVAPPTLNIASTTTLKARAFKSGSTDSAVASALYEIGTWSNTAGGAWKNFAVPQQTGTFTWTFRASVSAAAANATIGLSPIASTGVADLEPILWFNDFNRIQARNDTIYNAVNIFSYVPNTVYEFIVTVNTVANTYSATVGQIGQTPVIIATNYAFRGGNGIATELDNCGISVPTVAGATISVSQMSFAPVNPPIVIPTLIGATVGTTGTTLTLTYDVPVVYGVGGTGGWTINASGGAATLTPGANPTTFTISRPIAIGETGTISYTQPSNGVEASSGGGDLATITSFAFSNQSSVDLTAPIPNPSTFSSPPNAISSFAISMTATTATDTTAVQYYFDETSANPGGIDSGWQPSPTYTNAGLTPGIQYTYRVLARDVALNQTTPSASVDVTTPIIAGARLITPTKQIGAGFFNP